MVELGKIVSLLLSLSGRLVKVKSDLSCLAIQVIVFVLSWWNYLSCNPGGECAAQPGLERGGGARGARGATNQVDGTARRGHCSQGGFELNVYIFGDWSNPEIIEVVWIEITDRWYLYLLAALYNVFEFWAHVDLKTNYLKVAIDRRSSTVADYVESYLGSEERERFLEVVCLFIWLFIFLPQDGFLFSNKIFFLEVVATKVRLMVEIREIQEKVRKDYKNLDQFVADIIFSDNIRWDWERHSWRRCHSWRRPTLSTVESSAICICQLVN